MVEAICAALPSDGTAFRWQTSDGLPDTVGRM